MLTGSGPMSDLVVSKLSLDLVNPSVSRTMSTSSGILPLPFPWDGLGEGRAAENSEGVFEIVLRKPLVELLSMHLIV